MVTTLRARMHQHASKLGPDTHFSRPGPYLCGTALPDNSVDANGRRERRQPISAGMAVQIRLKSIFGL